MPSPPVVKRSRIEPRQHRTTSGLVVRLSAMHASGAIFRTALLLHEQIDEWQSTDEVSPGFLVKSVNSICSNSGKAMGGESAEKSKFLNSVQRDSRRGLAACMK